MARNVALLGRVLKAERRLRVELDAGNGGRLVVQVALDLCVGDDGQLPRGKDVVGNAELLLDAAAHVGDGLRLAQGHVEGEAKKGDRCRLDLLVLVKVDNLHGHDVLGDRLDEVVADIAANGGTARSYALDVTDKSAVQSVVAAIIADFGRLDVLINNAGLMPIRPMAEVNTDEWDQMIDVNLKGTLYGIAAALPGFLEQGSGHIINLSSVAGIKVFAPGGTVYSGTKFAVSAISEGLRHEVGEKVRVTSIEPGAVESDLKFTTSGTAAETVLDFYKQAIPTASVARAIAFAVEQPDDVDVNAIVIRPTAQEF